MKKTISTLLLFLLLFASIFVNAQSPWETHGKLEVAANGHYVQHKDGSPFLWVADTGWGLFQQLTREEVDLYLDKRQKQGFTVIQSVVFWYPHGGGIESGPHNAANAYGHKPFNGGDDAPDTSRPLVVSGGSSEAPNDYWDHIDYIVNAIKKRNMYLALLPCWGRAYVTEQFGGSHQEFNESEARSYGAFLGKRYKTQPHILWVIGGDAKAQVRSYDTHHIFQEFDTRDIFRAMAEGIANGVTGQNLSWNKANPAWKDVFMTYHPDGDATFNSSNWFQQDEWLTANGVEVWKVVNEVYPMMVNDYQRNDPAKPSLFLEGSYEYGSYNHDCGWVTPVRVRRQFYHTFFGGGAGHTYGAGPIWSMRGNEGDYNCGYTWQQALDFPGAVQLAQVGKNFLRDHKWNEWIPNGAVVKRLGEGESLKTGVTIKSGDMALVYFSNNSATEVNNILGKATTAYWFYPRNGEVKVVPGFEVGETKDMLPPNSWEDAILVLKANDK